MGEASRAPVSADAVMPLRLYPDGGIHLVAMWFRRLGDRRLLPTSQHTREARNLRARPRATAMIDRSVGGLDLEGVVVRGTVELVEGEEARVLNRSIHERYVSERGIALPAVAASSASVTT